MVWHDELKSDLPYDIIGGPQFPNANLSLLKPFEGSYSANGRTESGNRERTVDLRIDSETALISGDVFEDAERQDHLFSFISESIIFRKVDSTHLRIVCSLDMFDGKPVEKGGLLLRTEGGTITDCFIKTFIGIDRSLASSPSNDVTTGEMAGPAPYLRKVDLEVLHAENVTIPKIFKATATDIPRTSIVDSVEAAFERAGVRLDIDMTENAVPVTAGPGPDGEITNEELHALLVESAPDADKKRWSGRLLFASRATATPGVSNQKLGVMFDTVEPARQGAAVFLQAIADSKREMPNERERLDEIEYLKLHTTIHELGHMFNLLHSHQKDYDKRRTRISRGASLTWMAYRRLFPLGRLAGFVGRQNWQGHDLFRRLFLKCENFDREEIAHIRHGPYPEVVMGGTWAAEEAEDGDAHELRALADQAHTAELTLEVELADTIDRPGRIPAIECFSIPEGQIRLAYTGAGGLDLPRGVSPDDGNVELWVAKADSGRARRYSPPHFACGELDPVRVKGATEMLAPLPRMFGRNGWFAQSPGLYELSAVCRLPDGRVVRSSPYRFEVLRSEANLDKDTVHLLEDDIRISRFVGLHGSRTRYFDGVSELIRKLRRDHPTLAISRQLGDLYEWAGVRPISIDGISDLDNAARHENAARLLGLTDEEAPPAIELSDAAPMRATATVVDAYRAIAAYRRDDVNKPTHEAPSAAEQVKQRTTELLEKKGASQRLRTWAINMLKEKTELVVKDSDLDPANNIKHQRKIL